MGLQVEKHFPDGSKDIVFPDSTTRYIPALANDAHSSKNSSAPAIPLKQASFSDSQ